MTQLAIANEDVATLETAPTHYVEGHGIRFAYRRLGPSTGTPLILLQHFSGNIDAWDPAVVNALAADRPVIAFDNAGVGLSTGQTPDNVATISSSPRGVFPNRCAGPPPAAVLHEVVRQPVVRPGVPEADAGA